MKLLPPKRSVRPAPVREVSRLRASLAEANETLRAILAGEIDTLVGTGKQGRQVFTLEGAGHAYRLLIESMNEGALTLTADKMILYANACFARMVKCPLEQVTGSSLRRFLSAADQAALRPLLKRPEKAGSKIQVLLRATDGSAVPAQISIRRLALAGRDRATVGMVVTDMTEARRNEGMLRALTHRVVQVQEAERGRVALQLHDNITQLLCAVHFRSQTLAGKLAAHGGTLRVEAEKLREMLGRAVDEVEHISRNLRPSVLDQLGLHAVLQGAIREFAQRTGVAVKLNCVELATRLPPASELALFRIFQEALLNVGRHARASHVHVRLTKHGDRVQLSIEDDGVGFDAGLAPAKRRGKRGLGLLGMRERASYVGGELQIKSGRRSGTEIQARVPHAASADAA